MISKRISFINYRIKKNSTAILNKLKSIISKQDQVLMSLGKNYKNSFTKKQLNKYKSFSNFRIIAMGGSILGSQTIYDFLKIKIKKNFVFVDNLQSNSKKKDKKNNVNLIVSKSGNTIETIANTNLLIKKKDKNIIITENNKNYLNVLAQSLKAEIIHHNNFIGGRYSVLS